MNLQKRRSFRASALIAVLVVGGSLFSPAADAQANYCEASSYGVSTAATDNTAAFQAALNACAGKVLHVASGTYDFRPTGWAVGLIVPASTTVVGDGAGTTILQVAGTGGGFNYFFWIRNVSNVAIQRLTLKGNGYGAVSPEIPSASLTSRIRRMRFPCKGRVRAERRWSTMSRSTATRSMPTI